jgi:hypothetical protein
MTAEDQKIVRTRPEPSAAPTEVAVGQWQAKNPPDYLRWHLKFEVVHFSGASIAAVPHPPFKSSLLLLSSPVIRISKTWMPLNDRRFAIRHEAGDSPACSAQ